MTSPATAGLTAAARGDEPVTRAERTEMARFPIGHPAPDGHHFIERLAYAAYGAKWTGSSDDCRLRHLAGRLDELFSSTEILGSKATENMLAGRYTRRYPVGLEPVGQQVTLRCSATSKSAVSRLVLDDRKQLVELLAADLTGLGLVR